MHIVGNPRLLDPPAGEAVQFDGAGNGIFVGVEAAEVSGAAEGAEIRDPKGVKNPSLWTALRHG
jgi:hypothetical protein